MEGDIDDTDFIRCDLCNLLFNSVKPYEEHVRGSKHMKKEKNRTLRENKERTKSESADDSENHAKAPDEEDGDLIECEICEKTFSGIVPFKQHLNSGPHAKSLKRRQIISSVNADNNDQNGNSGDEIDVEDLVPKSYASCQTCGKQFTGPESYRDHLVSKVHKKKVKEAKYIKMLKESNVDIEKCYDGGEPSGSTNGQRNEQEQIHEIRRQLLQTAESTLTGEDESLEKKFSCDQCGKSFSGPAPLLQHLVSNLHKKKLKQIKILSELKSKISQQNEPSEEESADEDNEDDDEVLACVTCSVSFSGPENMMEHLKSKSHKKKVAFFKAKSKIQKGEQSKLFNSRTGTNRKEVKIEAKTDINPEDVPDSSLADDKMQLNGSIQDANIQELKTFAISKENHHGVPDSDESSSKKVDKETPEIPEDPLVAVDLVDVGVNTSNLNISIESSSKGEHSSDTDASATADSEKQGEKVRKKRSNSNLKKVANAVIELINEI